MLSLPVKAIALTLFLLLVAACSDSQPPLQQSSQQAEQARAVDEQISRIRLEDPNYLRQRMPDDALAYIRVPQLIAYLSAPKGDIFTPAMMHNEHTRLIASLQENLYRELFNQAGGLFRPLQVFWLQHTRSPVEIIVLANEHQQPLPRLLISTRLGFSDRKAFAAFLQDLVSRERDLYLLNDSMAEAGHASLASGPLSVELEYDADSRQLRALAGIGIDRQRMVDMFGKLVIRREHPMYASESEIDSSYQGLFMWLNFRNILTVAGNTMPPQRYQQIKDSIVADATTIAAGYGVSRGKGRFRFMIDFAGNTLQNTLPVGSMQMALLASGEPRMLAAMSLPSGAQLQALELNLRSHYPSFDLSEYDKFKQQFQQTAGIGLEQLLQAIGPDVLFLLDDLGEYSAVAVRDMVLYRQLLQDWVGHAGIDYRKLRVEGMDIHELKTQPWFMPQKLPASGRDNRVLELLLKARSHIYWVEEDGYLVFANVPQQLLDRKRYRNKVRVSEWLDSRQRQQFDTALLLASGRIQDSPSKLYYAYLQTLLLLADISDSEIDISRLPTAKQLALPDSGAYGMQFSVSDRRLAFELLYENNPLEIVVGNNLGSVAVVGILAAIAIPAYQDYIIRSQVNGAFHGVDTVRMWVSEYYRQHGKFPSQQAIDAYRFDDINALSITAVNIIADSGEIIVTLNGDRRILGKSLRLRPHASAQGLRWVCSGEIESRHLPRSCR